MRRLLGKCIASRDGEHGQADHGRSTIHSYTFNFEACQCELQCDKRWKSCYKVKESNGVEEYSQCDKEAGVVQWGELKETNRRVLGN